MTKVKAKGNTLPETTYASVAEYVKANPDFVNTETGAPPTEDEVKAGEVMTTHTEAGEGHTLTAVAEGARRRNRKTRKAPKFRRGGSTAPMDAARMRELKVQYENDLKKTDVDMRPKIVALANEFKSRPGPYMPAWGQSLLTTLNMSEEEGGGLEMAKAMLTGFFSNVPEVQDTTRKSMGGRTRKVPK
jgi:hypothetical protein